MDERLATNRRMLRVRDTIDRDSARPLDVRTLAAIAHVSEAHLIRTFRATFGETPHRYLRRRRIERAMTLLRTSERPVGEICLDVGFTGFATFSRTFREVVGESPSSFRTRGALPEQVPTCFVKAWTRPATTSSSSGTAEPGGRA